MNNLHRELAPIPGAAWKEIEDEASRTFERHSAGRRVVDVTIADDPALAAVGTGHLRDVAAPADGVRADLRDARPLVRLRVPFTLARSAIDAVERGAADADWDPVMAAAKTLAFVEDRTIFEGYAAAHITGVRASSSNDELALPTDPRQVPDVVAQAISELRLAGVGGPYALLLPAEVYTEVSETRDHGYPILEQLRRMVEGDIIWAPALSGMYVLTTRGGDFDLRIGTDVAIGYLAHDADAVHLYLQETLTFLAYTSEASVAVVPAG